MTTLFLGRFSGTPLSGGGLMAPRKVGGCEQTTTARAASPVLRKESGWRQPN